MPINAKKIQPPRPDWDYWLKLRIIKLTDAVSLTLNEAPEWVPGGNPYDLDAVTDWMNTSGYTDRLEILKTWADASDWLVDNDGKTLQVDLYKFTEFLVEKSFWHDLPHELLALIQPKTIAVELIKIDSKVDWVPLAQGFICEVIARNKQSDLHQTKSEIAEAVAKLMREKKIFNKHKQPLSAGTIEREAMKAKWWSAQNIK
jgi:hypothetical protein